MCIQHAADLDPCSQALTRDWDATADLEVVRCGFTGKSPACPAQRFA
jgi:hypothetical protein